MAETEEKKPESNPADRAMPVLQIGTYIAAAVAAVVTGTVSIGRFFYKNMSYFGAFKKENELRSQEYDQHFKKFGNDAHKGNGKEFRDGVNAIERRFNDRVNETLSKEFGVNNIADKWRTLKTHQKLETGLSVATIVGIVVSAGVGLGAVLSLVRENSKSRKVLEEELKRVDKARAEREGGDEKAVAR